MASWRVCFLAAALLAPAVPATAADGPAGNAANAGRAALGDCLAKIPADRLGDESAIAQCLEQGRRAAETEDKRQGQIEFLRRLDDMDRLIERTTRGSRRP
jgi:hypothetical protein